MKPVAIMALLCALLARPLDAQESATGHAAGHGIYRCMMEGGSIYYTASPKKNVDCKLVGSYSVPKKDQPDPSWTVLGVGEDSTMFYRKKGLTRKGNKVGLWVLSDYKAPQSEAGVSGFLSSVARWTIDCQETTISVDQATYYADHVGRGKPTGNWMPLGGGHPTYATPNSMG